MITAYAIRGGSMGVQWDAGVFHFTNGVFEVPIGIEIL